MALRARKVSGTFEKWGPAREKARSNGDTETTNLDNSFWSQDLRDHTRTPCPGVFVRRMSSKGKSTKLVNFFHYFVLVTNVGSHKLNLRYFSFALRLARATARELDVNMRL